MFKDELKKVLECVPFQIWEEIIEEKADKVYVYAIKDQSWQPMDIVGVRVRSGASTYELGPFGLLNTGSEILLKRWKPYRDLITKELEKYNEVLEKPTDFMKPALMGEDEYDCRYNSYMNVDWENEDQLRSYVNGLELGPVIKENILGKLHIGDDFGTAFREEACRLICKMVKQKISGKYDWNEHIDDRISELVFYYIFVTSNDEDHDLGKTEDIKKHVERFLGNKLSVKNLFKKVDDDIAKALTYCNENMQECIKAMKIDIGAKRIILEKLDWTHENGAYYEAYLLGICEGMLERRMPFCYELALSNEYELLKEYIRKDTPLYNRILETSELYRKRLDGKKDNMTRKELEDYEWDTIQDILDLKMSF